jgi:L-alanine-DL-glutamate epimerase-like enolase superfamily enzyme
VEAASHIASPSRLGPTVGKDPFAIEHCEVLNRDPLAPRRHSSALSAVEAAMFDIKGALGVPVYELGGLCPAASAYANGWFSRREPAQFALGETAALARFRALFDPFGSAYMQMGRAAARRRGGAPIRSAVVTTSIC